METAIASAGSKAGERQTVSLCLSTLGRTTEARVMLDSVCRQTLQPVETIVVDQNLDDRLVPILDEYADRLTIIRIHMPGSRGLSRGRNVGWRAAKGDFVLFPDDDCWYPVGFLEKATTAVAVMGADIVSGRAADETGRTINGRFESKAQWIDRRNVWTTQIEWTVLFRRRVLDALGGFDEEIGVGAATPWQACEGQDIVLRAVDAGYRAYYDPTLIGHHGEIDTSRPDATLRRKGRAYARGMGRVLRLHGYGMAAALWWSLRPLARFAMAAASLNPRRAGYYLGVSLGRIEGYAARGRPQGAATGQSGARS